jgi:H+/Cl- antiporter ClcA
LNGAHIPGIFSLLTTVVKGLGVVVVISCGFPVGREGPMVQVGCALAFQVLRLPFWQDLLRLKGGVEK